MFGQMRVTRMFKLSKLETVDEAVAELLEFGGYSKIFRWFQFPTALVVFLAHADSPDSGAVYVYERKQCGWLWVNLNDQNLVLVSFARPSHSRPALAGGITSANLRKYAVVGLDSRFRGNDRGFRGNDRRLEWIPIPNDTSTQNFGGYSPSEFDVMIKQCHFFRLVAPLCVLGSRAQWMVTPGQGPTVLGRLPA